MADLSSAKTLGGIGSILLVLTIAPSVGLVLGIVGWILILIALKYVSDVAKNGSIFSDALLAVILSILGLVVAGVLVIGSVFRFMRINGYELGSRITSTASPTDVIGLITGVAVGLVILWVFFMVSSIFLKRSLDKVSTALNVNMFRTAGLLYLVGAVLTIILIGFVLLFVAEILLIVAFFSIPDTLGQAPGTQPQTVATPPPASTPTTA